MNTFITGGSGLLGSYLIHYLSDTGHNVYAPPRKRFDLINGVYNDHGNEIAFLCAGTKGTQECEGNRQAFLADVDGNIRLVRYLLKFEKDIFIVFVSTDAVETSLNTAYARNRFMVELAIGGLPNVAIFRPGRFTKENVGEVAKALASVGLKRQEGLHRWP